MEIAARDIDSLYVYMCSKLLSAPKVGNTREINNVKITLHDIDQNIVSVRGLSPSYLIGELLWYFNADNSLEFISKFSKFWENISDDGVTSNSAYGYLLQLKHGFNQIEKVIEILEADPLSRRAKMNINFPNPNVKETKDEPCTMSLHFLIRDNKLDCTAIMRSNDVWFGFPYDVAFFTILQKYIAQRLGVDYGKYTHFAVSFHMYDRDEKAIREIVENPVHKYIKFDTDKFFANYQYIFEKLKDCEDIKTTTMEMVKSMGILTEDN